MRLPTVLTMSGLLLSKRLSLRFEEKYTAKLKLLEKAHGWQSAWLADLLRYRLGLIKITQLGGWLWHTKNNTRPPLTGRRADRLRAAIIKEQSWADIPPPYFSPMTRARMSAHGRLRVGRAHNFYGKRHTEEAKRKIGKGRGHLNHHHGVEARRKISEGMKGNRNGFPKHLALKDQRCWHCGKMVTKNVMMRWHGDRCPFEFGQFSGVQDPGNGVGSM